MNNLQSPPTLRSFAEKPLAREDLVRLVRLALDCGEAHYARMAALAWLTSFPGDLPVTLLHAKAMLKEGLVRQSLPILDNLCQTDPELLEAAQLLADTRQKMGLNSAAEAEACVFALGGAPKNPAALPKWAGSLRSARQPQAPEPVLAESAAGGPQAKAAIPAPVALEPGEVPDDIHQALLENPTTPLAAVTHLIHLHTHHPIPAAVQSLAQAYHQRWPRCLQFTLILADTLMDTGANEKAVALLHQVAAQDISAEVAKRLWSGGNPYASLWSAQVEINHQSPSAPQRIPIPAAVAAALGWNQLVSGIQPSTGPIPAVEAPTEPLAQEPEPQAFQPPQPSLPEQTQSEQPQPEPYVSTSLKEVREALSKSAQNIHKPELARLDGRFPEYVLLASRQGLVNAYGTEGADRVDVALRQLIPAITGRKTWNCLLHYPDAPQLSSMPALRRLAPVTPGDPWAFKLALTDLDKYLAEQGEMIGAVLIVGGPEVIPFHRLPNPIDDDDAEVFSDNPYSTRDENYFIPEWPVGRLPGGSSSQPDLLVQGLEKIARYHTLQARPLPWPRRLIAEVRRLLLEAGFPLPKTVSSLGYSAAIWRRASLSVFRPIGDPRALQVSPAASDQPAAPDLDNTASTPPIKLNASLGYFNLHGAIDASEWYGQRDPAEPGNEPEFPVALSPADIPTGSPAFSLNGKKSLVPQIVFSEACYGGHITNRSVDEAIALRFLQAGSLAVAGSTCISYGSISTPLIAADLLGRTFWRFLGEGCVAGEAMRRAKISLAREMHRRQGYLDGEDQKTLISFVLYGDPLAQSEVTGHGPKSTLRATLPQPVQTVCDRSAAPGEGTPVPDEVIAQVKTIVSQYLPGMAGARLSYTHERAGCHHAGHNCPSGQFGAKTLPSQQPDRQVVVLAKQIQQAQHTHLQYARLTLDPQGKLVKLVVSR